MSLLWLFSILIGAPFLAQAAASIPEEIEWTWGVRPLEPDAALPNVLLLGDSITRAYYPAVTRRLAGVANVYLFATSASVGDPRLPNEIAEFAKLQGARFRVIHFNNGMHGWAYSEAQYQAAFPAFLQAIRRITPGARLVWASCTPVKVESSPGPTNARVDRRDAIAKALIDAGRIPIDDQHALMQQHLDSFEDAVHFNAAGADIQGAQAAMTIKELL
jgi:lysophospholipase L1-like esterase